MQSQPFVFELFLFDKFSLLTLNQCLISESCPVDIRTVHFSFHCGL